MLQKDDFIARLSQKGYTKKDAGVIIDDFIKTLEDALIEGESVVFRGFGTFDVRTRAARETISINTDEKIVVPEYKSPHFTAGKRLKKAVKEGATEG